MFNISGVLAYGSENFAATSTVITQPEQSVGLASPYDEDLSTSITVLNPRDMVANTNVKHGGTCRAFALLSDSIANGNGNIFVFELAQSQYIEYVLAIGQGKDQAGFPPD